MVNKNIAIIILNWNGKKLLEQFLPSVIKHSSDSAIYIADNDSDDGSVEYLKSHFPTIKIIQNKENYGFAKGYNEALKQVKEDLFCLLNNDVEVTKNWLEPILNLFNNEPNTAAIQPKILDYKRKDYFEYAGAAGGFIDKYGFPYCRGRVFNTVEKDENQFNDNTYIFWASGACFFIRKAIFNKLNGFDESFFAHMEEVDLCWRIHNLGLDTKYTSEAMVYHVGGATLKNTNPKKTYLNFRNSLYTLTKNANGSIFKTLFVRLFLDGIASLRFLMLFQPLHALAVLRSHVSFYMHLLSLLKKRNHNAPRKKYYQKSNIAWLYYVKGRKHFNRL